MNKHITDNLDYYLSLENPEYAMLISGDWGCGKTHYINNYIGRQNKKDVNFVHISLFGLKTLESIDEQIFQHLYPILGSKYVKFAGGILKSAIKLGIKVDWNADGTTDGNANLDPDKLNLFDVFSDKKNLKKELVFIFDDLERTEIDISDILGYINYLVECSGFKVLVIANENNIFEGDCEDKYRLFKEKVIGKTFEVKHCIDDALNQFLDGTKSKKLLDYKHVIKKVYTRSKYRNLRHVKQSILDFELLERSIDEKWLKNEDFTRNLIYYFFSLNIEAKKGVLTEEHLNKNIPFHKSNSKDDETNILSSKYGYDSSYIFNGNVWSKLIFKSDFDGINDYIASLSFFLEKKEKPSWVKLWHYRILEDDEFDENLNDVIDNLQNHRYKRTEEFLHVIALLIFFSKNNLCNLTVNDINGYVEKAIEQRALNEHWRTSLVRNSSFRNGTGLSYMNDQDSDFKGILSKVHGKNKLFYEEEIKNKKDNSLKEFLNSIASGNEEVMENFLLEKYESEPILKYIAPDEFFDVIVKSKNAYTLSLFHYIEERYSENKSLNGRPYLEYLVDELNFWVAIRERIKTSLNISNNIKALSLNEFNEYIINDVINKLSRSSKS